MTAPATPSPPALLQPYSPSDLTPPTLDAVAPAARVALAYRRLCGEGAARWAEVLFGVAGGAE